MKGLSVLLLMNKPQKAPVSNQAPSGLCSEKSVAHPLILRELYRSNGH